MESAYIGIPRSGKLTKLLEELQKLCKSKGVVTFRTHIGIPGIGKTTKLLDELQKLDKNKSVVAFVENSELKKFKRRLPDADFYTKHDNLGEILKAKCYDTLIVDVYPSIQVNDGVVKLPDNILWVFSSIVEVANTFGILKDSIDALRKLDQEINSSKQYAIIGLE